MPAGRTQPRNRIAKIILDSLGGKGIDIHDTAPAVEILEPRILLSANPLSDIVKESNSAYTLPLLSPTAAEQNNTPATRSGYSAPTSNYILSKPSHLNGVIDFELSIIPGTNTVTEWGVNLIDRETGALVASLATGASAGAFPVSLDTRLFEDGVYYLQVTVRDETGRGSTSNREVTIDNTAPIARITSPSHDAEFSGMVVVRGEINDSTGESASLVWNLDLRNTDTGEVFSLCRNYRGPREPDGLTALTFFEPLQYPAGAYELVLSVADRAGNVTTTTTALNIVEPPESATAPKVVISHNAESTMTQGQTVEITVSSSSPYIRTMWLMVNGEKVSLDSQGRATIALSETGIYNISAYASNHSFQVGRESFSFEVVAADDEAPVVDIFHNAPSTIHPGQTVEFVVTADDNVGVASLEFTINGQNVSVGADGKANYMFAEIGVYEIKAVATDAAGNSGYRSFTLEVVALPDTEDPVVTITHNAPATMHPGQAVEFVVKADDNVGVESLVFTINGQEVAVGADGKANYIFADVGMYEIKAVATDAAGNQGFQAIRLEVVALPDTEDPVVTISYDSSTPIRPGQTVEFTVIAEDNIGVKSFEFTINGQKVAVGADGKVSYTFPGAGTYELKGVAVDAVGNIGTRVLSLDVAEATDTEAPVVNITPNTPQVVNPGQTVEFTVIAEDNVGVESLVVTINGQAMSVGANGKVSFTFTDLGKYEISAVATDAAGNTTEKKISVTVVEKAVELDYEKPVITFSHDQKSTTVKEGDTATFIVSATDNIGIANTILLVNGEEVALDANGKAEYIFGGSGIYVVKVVVTDTSGNEAVKVEVFNVPEKADTQRPHITITPVTDLSDLKVGQIVRFNSPVKKVLFLSSSRPSHFSRSG